MNKLFEEKRPYSANELTDQRNMLYLKYKLSDKIVSHSKCNHFYNVKLNSKKFIELSDNKQVTSNCSVCWKYNKTSENEKDFVYDLIQNYMYEFTNDAKFDFYRCKLEFYFYNWLYSN